MCSEAFQRHYSDIPVYFRIAIYLVKTICTAFSFFFFCVILLFFFLFSQVEIYFFKVLLPYGLSPKAK